ncbi:hypothetical protein GCM10009430_15220 [Aquimarina litoralis]|uniref:SIMPL domain-containing protein n=1 Tax=Aquimarina litoralis TaxID=584605 RepID=A0ABP3TTS7_9FLAO
MKKTIQILILTLTFSIASYGQSTERFIRIIGNAKKEITANKVKIQLAISEQKANKYDSNSKDISYEDAYKATVSELEKIGVKENKLQLFIQNRSYSLGKSKNYFLITDLGKLEKVSNIKVDGLKISEIKYLFDSSDENLETELSLKAINDAKRKAKAICKEINMKVGKILNIEVKESGYGAERNEGVKDKMIRSYRVAIMFKLID